MSKVQELLHLKEEVRAAISGLNQELKEIILKYDKVLKIESLHVKLVSNHTDELDAETAFVLADDECDPEIIAVLEKPIFGADEDEELVAEMSDEDEQLDVEDIQSMQDEIDLTGDDDDEPETVKPLPRVPVKFLDTKAHLILAHRNSKSKALLFESHPILQ